MDRFSVSFLLCAACSAWLVSAQYGQSYQTTTPVPILKQIDRHNEDGSYSFGYEGADGTFKIETKYPTGEVYGKYGFVDDTGKVREVEYGASQRGFEPMGTDINVPPTSIQGNTIAGPNDPEDDGQYREDPSIYHTDPKYTNGEYYRPLAKRPKYSSQQDYQIQKQTPSAAQVQPQSQYQPMYQRQYQSQYQPTQYQQEYQTQSDQYEQYPEYQTARSYQPRSQFRQYENSDTYANNYYNQ